MGKAIAHVENTLLVIAGYAGGPGRCTCRLLSCWCKLSPY